MKQPKQFNGVIKKKKKVYNTRYFQAVNHPSTILARQGLTSGIERDPVLSLWFFFMFKANGSPSVRKCNGCQTERPTRHNATVRLKRGSTSSATSPGNRTPPRTNVTNITDKNYKTETNKQRPQTNKKKHNEHNNNKTSKTDKGILSIWRTRGSPVDRLIQHKVLVCQIGG